MPTDQKQIINTGVIPEVIDFCLFLGYAIMSESSISKPARPWRVVAEEASHEYDPIRMADLMRELNQALQEQGLTGSDVQSSEKKSA